MSGLDDFVPNRPYVAEAKRRVAEHHKELGNFSLGPNPVHFGDAEVAELMADYAAAIWQEGYEDGYGDGLEDGYNTGYQDAEREQ